MALYEKQYTGDKILISWRNYPETSTPISADNLQRSHRGIQAVDDATKAAFDDVERTMVTQQEAGNLISGVEFDRITGRFVFHHFDNTIPDTVYDTVLEKVIVNFDYDAEKQALELTQEDGQIVEVPLSSFIAEPDMVDSDTIVWKISADGKASAEVADHSITDKKLEPSYLEKIKEQVADTDKNVKSAQYYSDLSKSYANGTSNLEDRPTENVDNAKAYFEKAAEQAKLAQSYSDGTPTDDSGAAIREGQDTDNAKYYADLAAKNGESWTHGGVKNADDTDFRDGQDTDNAEYWANEAKINAGFAEFQGATADANGKKGLVPEPQAGDEDKALLGNGTWGEVKQTVDSELSETSINPVENRAISLQLLPLIGTVNSLKKTLNEIVNTGYASAALTTGSGAVLKTGDGKYIIAKCRIGNCDCNKA